MKPTPQPKTSGLTCVSLIVITDLLTIALIAWSIYSVLKK